MRSSARRTICRRSRQVTDDAAQPRPESLRILELGQVPTGHDKSVLGDVLRQLEIRQDRNRRAVGVLLVSPHKLSAARLVARLRCGNQCRVGLLLHRCRKLSAEARESRDSNPTPSAEAAALAN